MLNTTETLCIAKGFAGALVFGDWGYVDSYEFTTTHRHIVVVECETTIAHITVCAITGAIEKFEFTHKGDA